MNRSRPQAEAPPAEEPEPASAGALDERVEALRLAQLARSVSRVPLAPLCFNAFGGWLLWRAGWPAAGLAWFLAVGGLHGWRGWAVRRWRTRPLASARAATDWLGRVTLLQTLLMVLLIGAVFAGPDAAGPYVVTTLCMGVAAGAVGAAGWREALFTRWALLVGGSLIAGWLQHEDAVGAGMAIICASLLVLLRQQVRDQQRALERLVSLAWDNERLIGSLRDERDRAQAASASKTRFFAAASHDLRQPLHALGINASTLSMLAHRQGDVRIARLSDGIDQALRQSNHLLDGLLDVSRLEAGAVQPEPVTLDAAAFLDGVAQAFRPMAQQRGLALDVVLAAPAEAAGPNPWAVRTDPDLLHRVLHNLVSNALKFTRTGGVQLQLAPAAGGGVELAVQDSGPGIAADEQLRVFEEFYQVANPARDRGQGLGLGLSIVRRIADLLALPLQLRSTPGQGTRVSLLLPAAPGGSVCTPPAIGPAGVQAQCLEPLGLRVLVIDDEAAIRDAMQSLLEQLGCSVRCAEGGEDALRLVAQGFLPQVLLADHRLRGEGPLANGVGVLAALQARLGPVPALVLTGDTAPDTLQQVLASGHPVLHKPVDGLLLAQRLRALAAQAA